MLKIERERNGKQRIGEPKEKREKSVPEENRQRKRKARAAPKVESSSGGMGNGNGGASVELVTFMRMRNEKSSSNIIQGFIKFYEDKGISIEAV